MRAASLLLTLLLGSCGLIADANRLGVTPSGQGGVRVHFVPCPGEAVTRVALIGNVGAGVHLEDGNDRPGDDPDDDEVVLWSASAPGGSTIGEFELGRTPSGFTEEIPLVGRVADHGSVGAFVGYRKSDGGLASLEIGFGLDQLEPGRILTLDDYKDPATFERDAEALCAE